MVTRISRKPPLVVLRGDLPEVRSLLPDGYNVLTEERDALGEGRDDPTERLDVVVEGRDTKLVKRAYTRSHNAIKKNNIID